jgi:hypothetical protein
MCFLIFSYLLCSHLTFLWQATLLRPVLRNTFRLRQENSAECNFFSKLTILFEIPVINLYIKLISIFKSTFGNWKIMNIMIFFVDVCLGFFCLFIVA